MNRANLLTTEGGGGGGKGGTGGLAKNMGVIGIVVMNDVRHNRNMYNHLRNHAPKIYCPFC